MNHLVTITYHEKQPVRETSVFRTKTQALRYTERLRDFWSKAIKRKQVNVEYSGTTSDSPAIMRERDWDVHALTEAAKERAAARHSAAASPVPSPAPAVSRRRAAHQRAEAGALR